MACNIVSNPLSGSLHRKTGYRKIPRVFLELAEWTGLEPATPGVTGRYSNQLNYHSVLVGAAGIEPATLAL